MALEIRVWAGGKSKPFKCDGRRIKIGRGRGCQLVLPVRWFLDEHLVIDQGRESLRIKACSSEVRATADGQQVGTDWISISSPGTVIVQSPTGGQIGLQITSLDRELGTPILRGPAPEGMGDEPQLALVSADLKAEGQGWLPDQGHVGETDGDGTTLLSSPAAAPSRRRWSTSTVLSGVTIFWVVMIVGALGLNRYLDKRERQRADSDSQFVTKQIGEAQKLLDDQQYEAAKVALESALPIAKRHADLATSLARIERMQELPEIRLGADGYVRVDGQWLQPSVADAWREARVRDDPKIEELIKQADAAIEAQQFDQGRQACEQALAIIKGHPVKEHPKRDELERRLAQAKDAKLNAEMAAKGLALYQGKWVPKEQKHRLEQQAKGLVEYQGVWMTPQEKDAAVAKGGTGRILYKGKWVTYDEKMAAEGYEKFEGTWLRPEQVVEIQKRRDREAAAAAERKAEEKAKKAALAAREKLKEPAYKASQQFALKELPAATRKQASFPPFEAKEVTVLLEDDGWIIVKSPLILKAGARETRKSFLCRLRPKGADWESSLTVIRN